MREISQHAKESSPQKWARSEDKCFMHAETSSYEDVTGVKNVFNDISRYIIRN